MLQLIHDAGWPVWLLIATSVLGLALVIERFMSLRTRHILPEHLLGQVLDLMRQKRLNADTLERLSAGSPLGRILAEVILVRGQSDSRRASAIEDVGKDVGYRLNRYVPTLATISVVAPLLGLFGTVVGMIEIFGSYSPSGGDPSQLARGISIALYNTGFGILIAIPALLFHRYFRFRVDYYLLQLERQASALDRALSQETGP